MAHIENQNNEDSNDVSGTTRVRHGDENKENSDLKDSNNKDNNEETPLNDDSPIIIESMDTATHSNMQTLIETDMVDNYRRNIEFQRKHDQNFNQQF